MLTIEPAHRRPFAISSSVAGAGSRRSPALPTCRWASIDSTGFTTRCLQAVDDRGVGAQLAYLRFDLRQLVGDDFVAGLITRHVPLVLLRGQGLRLILRVQ